MQAVLKKFMEEIASRNKIQMVVAEGIFTNTHANKNALNLPGSVYGFCVRLNEQERYSVFTEAKSKKTNKLFNVQEWLPLRENIYPLYWGKDKRLGARIQQHLQNNARGTGLARLCAYTTLHNKEIACVALTVTKYSELEDAIQNECPHLLLAVDRVL